MTIKKYQTKKGIRYAYEIQYDGERYSKGGFTTRLEAREAEVEATQILRQRANDLDLQYLILERTKHIKETCTEDYLNENIRTLNRFIHAMKGKVFVTDVTRDDVESFLDSYDRKHGYNYALAKINALFRFGVDKEWTTYNPCNGIKRKATDKKLKYVPPPEDLDAVINIAGRDKPFLLVLKHTLARVNEVYNLTWEDIDLDRRQITLWTRKKTGGVRTPRHLTINDVLFSTLSGMERVGSYVFVNPDTGKPYDDRKRLIAGLCRKAGVKRFTFHSFRHFGASQLAMKGVSLPEIQMILGHDNVITTSKYIQSLGINKTEAINLLE